MEPNPQEQNKPRLGQGRAGLRRKMKIPMQMQPQIQTSEVEQVKEQTLPKQKEVVQPPLNKSTTDRSIGHMPETCIVPGHTIRPRMNAEQVPFYLDPLIKPSPRPPDIKTQDNWRMTLDLDLDINNYFEENSPYQEGIIVETYQRPDKSQLLEPPELADFINTNNLVQKYLPEQTDMDKILKIIERKVLEGTYPCNHKGDTSGIFKQPIFQRYIPIFSTKQITKFKESYMQS